MTPGCRQTVPPWRLRTHFFKQLGWRGLVFTMGAQMRGLSCLLAQFEISDQRVDGAFKT